MPREPRQDQRTPDSSHPRHDVEFPDSSMDEVDLARELLEFARQVEALAHTLPTAMYFLLISRKTLSKAQLEFLEQHGELLEDTGEKKVFQLPESAIAEASRIRLERDRLNIGCDALPRSFVVSLVSHFDFFLSRLLRGLFLSKPDLLNASDRQFTYSQLLDLGSVEAARQHLIEKEIETVLRDSHPAQFEWLEKKFGLPLTKNLAIWPTYVELTERRNLFVHTNGVVSTQYLAVCKKHGVKHAPDVSLGAKLDAEPGYFETACRCVMEIGLKLGSVLWRKVLPHQRAKADQALMELTFELLKSEDYEMVKVLGEFARETIRIFSKDETRRIILINEAIAYHLSDDDARCSDLVDREDWSACSDKFRMAVAVLKNQRPEALNLMRRIGANGDFTEEAYRHWPLFRAIRSTPEFAETFKEVFGHDLAASPAMREVHTRPKHPTKGARMWESLLSELKRHRPSASASTSPSSELQNLAGVPPVLEVANTPILDPPLGLVAAGQQATGPDTA